MTDAVDGITLARHDERIRQLEERLTRLEESLDELREKIDRLQWWLVATAGGVATSVVLLALNLMVRRP